MDPVAAPAPTAPPPPPPPGSAYPSLQPEPPPRRHHLPLVLGLITLFVIAGGLTALVVYQRRQAPPPPAPETASPDSGSTPAPRPDESSFPLLFNFSRPNKIGQSFQLPTTDRLLGLHLRLKSASTGKLVVNLYELSDPEKPDSGTRLASAVSVLTESDGESDLNVYFPEPVLLQSGISYIFIVEPQDQSSSARLAYYLGNSNSTGHTYMYLAPVSTPGQPPSSPNSWVSQPDLDLVFNPL